MSEYRGRIVYEVISLNRPASTAVPVGSFGAMSFELEYDFIVDKSLAEH